VQQRKEVLQRKVDPISLRGDHPGDTGRFEIGVDQQDPAAGIRLFPPWVDQLAGERETVQGAAGTALERVKGADPYAVRKALVARGGQWVEQLSNDSSLVPPWSAAGVGHFSGEAYTHR